MRNITLTHNEIGWFKYTGVSLGWTWYYTDVTDVRNIYAGYNYIQ